MPFLQTYTPSAANVAEMLLAIGAIRLQPQNPFTWASGWKSPIYCDNRLALSFPAVRSQIKDQLRQLAAAQFKGVEAIAGVATAGIPQGVLLAEVLGLPFLYVRSKPKGHGMENLIEGQVTPGQKVLVVEDLISTGGSSLKAVQALQAAKMEVLGMAAIFTYGFAQAEENFKQAGVKAWCLSNYQALLPVAQQQGLIDASMLELLQNWRKDPAQWQPAG